MKILCIDTSSNVCSVAILNDSDTIYEYSTNDGLTHSQNLMPMVDKAFKTSSISFKDIDLYTCSIGPGSFTGIRIGVATIKAFVDVYNKPSIGISSLEGLAYNTNSNYVCSIIDAKHDNVYCRMYQKNENMYIPITSYMALSIEECLNQLSEFKNINISFIGDGSIIYRNSILNKFTTCTFADNTLNLQNAVSIGKAAYYKHINNIASESVSPLYLKKSQAEISKKKFS